MMELKPCPFCGRKLLYVGGKRVNRYYKGEPTRYQHPQNDDCILGKYGYEVKIWNAKDVDAWNRRITDDTEKKTD